MSNLSNHVSVFLPSGLDIAARIKSNVVFAADAENKNTGYALAPSEVAKLVSETASLMQEIETGSCAKAA